MVTGKIVKADYGNKRYKVKYDKATKWFCQCELVATEIDRKRQDPKVNKLCLSDFVLQPSYVSSVMNLHKEMQPTMGNINGNTHATLIQNALSLNLSPHGEIPRDGNCMFHAIAQSMSELELSHYSQVDIRNSATNWLASHPVLDGDTHLADFVVGRDWDEYLESMNRNEWGDHLALIGIANAFNVAIGIVSSENANIHYINPILSNSTPRAVSGTVYLGHEFETHYIRLVPLQGPMSSAASPQAVMSGNIVSPFGSDLSDSYDSPAHISDISINSTELYNVSLANTSINSSSTELYNVSLTENTSSAVNNLFNLFPPTQKPVMPKLLLCHLPNELLFIIFQFVLYSGIANLSLLEHV